MDISEILKEVRTKLHTAKSETINDLQIAVEKGNVDEYDRLAKNMRNFLFTRIV